MAYEGELMTSCPRDAFDFSRTYAVIVSGQRHINPWGHMLLNTGGSHGNFFQVSDKFIGQPFLLNEQQFQRYLSENNKTIISVKRVPIPYPEKSQLKLEELLSKKRAWLGVVHNCEGLVEEIVIAGGGPKLRHGLFALPIKATNVCTGW